MTLDIRALRASPELPDAYFAARDAFDAYVVDHPFFKRPRDVAILHAVHGLEGMLWKIRPLGEREISLRRSVGTRFEIGAYSGVIHGVNYGFTHLVRLLERHGASPAGAVEYDPQIASEAASALHRINGIAETYVVFTDTELGWRECAVVDARTLRLTSKSPERFARGLALPVAAEAEENARIITRAPGPRAALFRYFASLASEVSGTFEPSADTIDLTLLGQVNSWRTDEDPLLTDDLYIAGRCSVGEYRRTVHALRAYGLAQQAVTDFQSPRPGPHVPRRTREEWIQFARRHAQLPSDEVAASALDLLLHSGGRDLRNGGRVHPSAAHTPLFDVGDGTWILASTLTVWQVTDLALRSIWKNRAPDSYNATVAGFNHSLSTKTADIFRGRRWPAVERRQVGTIGDIDAGTSARDDRFFLCCECKVFLNDPVRQADDIEVWRKLDEVVSALKEDDAFARILGGDGLKLGEIRGLLVVPGRAQSSVNLGEEYGLVGLDDLRDAAAASATPRELWARLKAAEVHTELQVVEVRTVFGEWTLISDGVRRSDVTEAELARRDAPRG